MAATDREKTSGEPFAGLKREDGFSSLSKMNFDLTEEQVLLLEQVDRACKKLRPIEDKCYLEDRFNDQVKTIFAESHVLGLPISTKYGDGQGADMVTYALALERTGREGTGVRTFLSGHVALFELPVQKWGTEEQKQKYLVPGTKGEKVYAFGLTEPDAGSDPSALKTSFEEKNGSFVLNGEKMWISNGSIADAAIIFAYPKGKRDGMCAFIVDKDSPGFSATAMKNKLGLPTADTGDIVLNNCIVPKENMLGPMGKGLSVAYSTLMGGRLSVAAGCVGVIQDCLDEAVRYSKIRVQHGKLIGKHQLVQEHIGQISTNLASNRLLTLEAAYFKQKHEDNPADFRLRDQADIKIAQAKFSAAHYSFDAANRAVQIFGANGYSLENRPARHLKDTRVTMIYEGTEEILVQKIAVGALGSEFQAYS